MVEEHAQTRLAGWRASHDHGSLGTIFLFLAQGNEKAASPKAAFSVFLATLSLPVAGESGTIRER
jgi:hypothetical protein